MFKTTSLRQFSERNNKPILNKSNKLTLLSSASLLTLAACGETTTAIGEVTANKIAGTTGDDTINGTESRDIITSFAGDDIIYGGEGNDNIDGGEGYDGVSYENSETAVYVFLDGSVSGTGNFNGFDLDTLSNIEAVIGSDFNDTIYGNAANNGLEGGHGDDTLEGGTGIDTAIIDADSVNYVIYLVGNKIDVVIDRSGIISHDYLDSIETLRLNGVDSDIKDLYADPNSDASTVFTDVDAFKNWLGDDLGYNYEAL